MKGSFQMLTNEQKEKLLVRIGPVLAEVRAKGRAEIAEQNALAVQTTGRPRFEAGLLATMVSWPQQYQCMPACSAEPRVIESLVGPDEELYSFCRGDSVMYTEHRAGWKALRQELDIVREVLGLTSDEEAHAVLPEIHRDFSYGVVVLALLEVGSVLYTPVGIRSKLVGSNERTLSLLGGFVHPDETVFAAAQRQLTAEGRIMARFCLWGAWGPHNVAPSATFVLPAYVEERGVGVAPPADAWEFEGKVFSWVPLGQLVNLLVAPDEAQSWFLRHFAGIGLSRDEIRVAPDIVRPTLDVIKGLRHRRSKKGLFET